jgi:zinc protease
MLTMLTRGSEKYPYADFQRILFEKSSSISPSYASFDMSSLDLVTIDRYFDDLLPVFADAFLHPAWNAEEFPRVISNMEIARQGAENDPYQRSVIRLNDRFFAGHPYAAGWDGTLESLSSITLTDVKSYYENTVVSGRLFLVAVGNFDRQKLIASLNATFGAMPRKGFTRPAVPAFTGTVKPDLVLEPFDESEGLAYVRGDFAIPGQDSPDYPALQVAFSLLDDLLFEIVRTRHGAAYGASAGLHGFSASYGDITIYRTNAPDKVKGYVDEAIGVLLSGQCLAAKVSSGAEGKSGIGQETDVRGQRGVFVPVADALPFTKSQFLSRFFSGQETNSSIALQIASSVVYHGDYRDYLLVLDRINAVTAEDVARVTRAYLANNPTLWVALADASMLKNVKRESYVPR